MARDGDTRSKQGQDVECRVPDTVSTSSIVASFSACQGSSKGVPQLFLARYVLTHPARPGATPCCRAFKNSSRSGDISRPLRPPPQPKGRVGCKRAIRNERDKTRHTPSR